MLVGRPAAINREFGTPGRGRARRARGSSRFGVGRRAGRPQDRRSDRGRPARGHRRNEG